MAGFVFCHFMHGVVDGVEVEFFGATSDAHLVFVGTCFGRHTFFEVGLGVPDALAEEFGKFGCVFGLFPRIALECFSDFGIAFAVCLALHADFAAFAVEVSRKIRDHLFVATFGHTDFVLCDESEFCRFIEFFELGCGCTAEGAFFGCVITFVYVATDGADKFLFHNLNLT